MTPVFKTCVAVKDILGTSQALVAAAPGQIGANGKVWKQLIDIL